MSNNSLKDSEPFREELQTILGSILDDYAELQKEAEELRKIRDEAIHLRREVAHYRKIDEEVRKFGIAAGVVQHDDPDKCGDDCCGCMMLGSDSIAHELYKRIR